MIELIGLRKSFGACRAIDDVTLSVHAGTVTCVLGLNGAGKTTLLRLVAGFDKPDRGAVLICGRSLYRDADPMRILGVHLDPDGMNPRHTVRRHLLWLAAIGGLRKERIDDVLAEVGLITAKSHRISTLSMGARQRLAIASALLGDPQVLIFDEPLNGLDVPGIVWLRDLLRRLCTSGKTVLLASHVLSEVVLTADRLVIMDSGKVAAQGAVAEIIPVGADPREHLEARLLSMADETAGHKVSR